MAADYLIGRLTVNYAIDTIALAYKVQGRFSYVDLGHGDSIEVENEGDYKEVSIQNVIETTVDNCSERHTFFNLGQSMYEGVRARVRLNPNTSKLIEENRRKYFIKQLFKQVEAGGLSQQDAVETLLKWETDFEE
ncbi:hypothetical protein [Bacillus suaedae]|uniref:Uncharacterized protein n=1 Tax=Halalkalibacter suaedae TaxID=2822140 RepID=A0A941AR45_9BACI|nr:hypothetical protein [Bacillus suaedae]MBP3953622.1 hypothetical protein [Bacillus suaedae]